MSAILAGIKLRNVFINKVYKAKRNEQNLDWLNEAREDLRYIATELRPNGGKSLKDAVHRIDKRTERHEKWLERLDNRVDQKADK